MGVIGIFVLFGILALGVRLIAGGMDKERIRNEIRGKGGRVESMRWSPFGRGWFGEKGERIYEATYTDDEGNEHRGTYKTSLLSGVYSTDDRVVRKSHKARRTQEEIEQLRQENDLLREELERLREAPDL